MAEETIDQSEATTPDLAPAATEAPIVEEAPAAPKPLMSADDAGDNAPAKPTDFPDDWRERLSGEDKALGNMLSRLGSPADMVKKLAEQEKLIRSGKHKAAPGVGASDKELAEYRKANGIPEAPEGYLEKLDGLVIGDADKEGIDEFLADAHAINMDPRAVKTALGAYYKIAEKKADDLAKADADFRSEAVEQMREAMGADYKGNMADLKAWFSSQEGLLDTFASARGPDGRLLGDNPAIVGWLVQQMREINPLATVVGDSGRGTAEGVADRIKTIEGIMRTDRAGYERDEGMQAELRKLYEAEDRLKKRAA